MQKPRLINYINKFLEYSYLSLFFITPLIMTSVTSELFEFNKMLFIYFAAIFILFGWLLKMILIKKIIIKKTYLDIPIYLFFFSQLISTFLSIDFHTSIFGYYGRFNGGLLSIICYIIFYYALVSNYQDFNKNYLLKLLKTILLGSLMVILWGLPGKFGYDLSCFLFSGKLNNSCWTAQFRPAERLFSTLGQPNWLGAYLAVTFFIGLYFYFKNSKRKYLILNTLYLILNFITLLFTRSRSSLIAVGVGFLIFIPLYLFLIEKNIKKVLGICILLFVLLVICRSGIPQVDRFFDLKTYSPKKNTVPAKTNKKIPVVSSDITESGDIRKIVWQGAVDLGKKYPLFGTGVETFAYAYYFVRPKSHNLTSEWDYLYNKAHNEYLNYFATTGLFGLGTYLFMISIVIIIIFLKIADELNNDSRLLLISLFSGYITILITNFFGFSISVINLFFYLLPAVVFILFNSSEICAEKKIVEYRFNSIGQKTGVVILSLFFLYTTIYLIRYFLADLNYAKGDSYYKTGNYQAAGSYLNEALKFKYEHIYEDKLSYILANLAFISAYQKEGDSVKQLVKLANYYNKKSLEASPKNSLYWKTKAKNYYLFYQISQNLDDIKKGIDALKEAKLLAPTDPKISYSLSIFYSLMAEQATDFEFKKEMGRLALKEADRTIKLKSNDQSYKDMYKELLNKKDSFN